MLNTIIVRDYKIGTPDVFLNKYASKPQEFNVLQKYKWKQCSISVKLKKLIITIQGHY